MSEQPQTSKIALVVVLALILTGVLLVRLGIVPVGSQKDGGSKPAPADTSASSPPVTKGTAAATGQWKRPEAVGVVVRDPTRMDASQAVARPKPDAAAPPSEPEHTVAGIVFNPQQPSAVIIDGHVLHEGDTFDGVVIVKITEESAELRRGDKTWTVKPGERYRGSEAVRPRN